MPEDAICLTAMALGLRARKCWVYSRSTRQDPIEIVPQPIGPTPPPHLSRTSPEAHTGGVRKWECGPPRKIKASPLVPTVHLTHGG